MAAFYFSLDLTAFVSTREIDGWHVGVVSVLLGTQPSRVEEECLALRNTASEALQDAQCLASAVLAASRNKVRL
jgi:hypothetical protein